jgi:SAM-dependent methyltransferase
MSQASSGTPGYALGRSEAETQRLILQHQIYGPMTRQFLNGAGVGSGMTVLDVGSGAGDVTVLLADLVGPQGRVVGVDTNAEILEVARERVRVAGWSNVTLFEGDIHELARRDEFDAVVGRWVLMYLSDPTAVLRAIGSLLGKGGLVAFQEGDLSNPPAPYPPTPLHEQVRTWTTPPPGAPGPDTQMGLKLYRTYVAAGLPAPMLRLDTPIGGGAAWPGFAYLAATVRSLLPFLEQLGGVSADEVDVDTLEERLRAELVALDGIQILPPLIGAWARI